MIIMMMIVEQWVSGVKNIFVLHQIRVGSGIANCNYAAAMCFSLELKLNSCALATGD